MLTCNLFSKLEKLFEDRKSLLTGQYLIFQFFFYLVVLNHLTFKLHFAHKAELELSFFILVSCDKLIGALKYLKCHIKLVKDECEGLISDAHLLIAQYLYQKRVLFPVFDFVSLTTSLKDALSKNAKSRCADNVKEFKYSTEWTDL